LNSIESLLFALGTLNITVSFITFTLIFGIEFACDGVLLENVDETSKTVNNSILIIFFKCISPFHLTYIIYKNSTNSLIFPSFLQKLCRGIIIPGKFEQRTVPYLFKSKVQVFCQKSVNLFLLFHHTWDKEPVPLSPCSTTNWDNKPVPLSHGPNFLMGLFPKLKYNNHISHI
jgi:hypothetical protein